MENFEFIWQINHVLNGENRMSCFQSYGTWGVIKIKSINLLEFSDWVNWWTVILQLSIGKQWKEFLDYNDTVGFTVHVRTLLFMHVYCQIPSAFSCFAWWRILSLCFELCFQDDAKKDRGARNRYTIWLVESFLDWCMLGRWKCFIMQDWQDRNLDAY